MFCKLVFWFQGLKSHAVTMFEVGKMLDEGLDSLLAELGKIQRLVCRSEVLKSFFLLHFPSKIGLVC